MDGWALLARTFLTDRWDWTGVGHIDAVLKTAEHDRPCAPLAPSMGVESGAVAAPWATRAQETAASFIQRVAGSFNGWDVGFRADGTFFYLPRDYTTTPSVTFYPSQAAADAAGAPTAPLYRDPVVFTTVPPEANVILVRAGKAATGGIRNSALFVDWTSIKNPAVVNWLGHRKAECGATSSMRFREEVSRVFSR